MNYNRTEMNSRAFSFIYGCALRDAILQKSFIGKKDWIEKVTEAQEPVRKYINSVLTGEFNKDNDKINPARWVEVFRPEARSNVYSIIYETHVRELITHISQVGNEKYSGTFLGLDQRGTRYSSGGVRASAGYVSIKEFKELVLAFNGNDINVIIEVAFNHSGVGQYI